MIKALGTAQNFLGIPEEEFFSYANSHYVIQQVPYEYTSSYLSGSDKGPAAIVRASQYVELYDEELDMETYRKAGIATLKPLDFKGRHDKKAVDFIEEQTSLLLKDKKFVVSLGAEHTVTLGFVKAHQKFFKNFSVLQIDAHSDLREAYHSNPYSHASVMKRIHDLGIPLVQVGIRAQCIEEAQLIKKSKSIHTYYAHQIRSNSKWADKVVTDLSDNVYVTIDADGFDPSIMPAVGTAEPNGLFWSETLNMLEKVASQKNIIGFDIVECAPAKGSILSEFTLAKLAYRLIGYIEKYKKKRK